MAAFIDGGFLSLVPYTPPRWARGLKDPPTHRFNLVQKPTPIHRWHVPGVPDGCELYVKRDDLTGAQLSGNKARKLEFLLADAVARDADCVITIGGVQSNHCRATAVASRYLGLDAHLILRTSKATAESGDPGLVGNLMVERAVGGRVHMVTKREYAERGSVALGEGLRRRLQREGRRPYVIPVGGSNAVGTWGYVEMIEELRQQLCQERPRGSDRESDDAEAGARESRHGRTRQEVADREDHDSLRFTDVVMACGSGGTAAGIALGCRLCPTLGAPAVHAFGVCDTPEYFYGFIEGILHDMGAVTGVDTELGPVERLLTCHQAKGAGYAMATEDEMRVVVDVAAATGVVLDPVYSGKAINGLLKEMTADPSSWAGRRVLFIHTGGMLGMYDKLTQLQPLVEVSAPAARYQPDDLNIA